jgi:RimJ/RimL family protein N-acetyltransferase
MVTALRTFDSDVIRAILWECWDEFAEDTADPDFHPSVEGEFWLLAVDDGVAAGVLRVAFITSSMAEIHVAIRKPYRSRSVEYATAYYCWLLKNLYNLKKLVANIPEFNRPSIRYAIANGMTRQGYNSDSYLKNGELRGMVSLGITRQQMEEIICRRSSQSLQQSEEAAPLPEDSP